jgi:hypothetical protein
MCRPHNPPHPHSQTLRVNPVRSGNVQGLVHINIVIVGPVGEYLPLIVTKAEPVVSESPHSRCSPSRSVYSIGWAEAQSDLP